MTCPEIQNRLLAVLVPNELSPGVRSHLDGCELCRRFQERAVLLDAELAALTVPPSDDRKLAFLESLAADGPIIKSIPRSYVNPGRDWRVVLKPLAGLAAAVAVGVSVWVVWPAPTTPLAKEPFRHELLQRVVKLQRELVTANRPHEQLRTMTHMATELRYETAQLAKVADAQELQSLAKMYESVVANGVVAKAHELTLFNSNAAERQAVLTAAREELSQTMMTANGLIPAVSSQVRTSLEQIVTAARDGLQKLPQEI